MASLSDSPLARKYHIQYAQLKLPPPHLDKRNRSQAPKCFGMVLLMGVVFLVFANLMTASTATSSNYWKAERLLLNCEDCPVSGAPRGVENHRTQSTLQLTLKRTNQKKKLSFVHIPKTGGSAVELAAARHNISWGGCAFKNLKVILQEQSSAQDYPGCQRFQPGEEQDRIDIYHKPPATRNLLQHPYYANKSLFAVVRNPYTKLISEYYCPFKGYKGADKTPETLNQFILDKLKHKPNSDHMLPQTQFVFDYTKNVTSPRVQVVDHVLFFENLTEEMNLLMKEYNLPVTMLKQRINGNKHSDKMGLMDLSDDTIARINDFYRDDFDLLGYLRIQVLESYSVESVFMARSTKE